MSQLLTLSRTTFHNAGAARDPLHELALRSSYNKSERLDVPVFLEENKKRLLPKKEAVARGIPFHGKSGLFQASIALPVQALGIAMTSDLRFEPLNNTLLHRSYASARGLFPIDVDFVFSNVEGETRLVFDESHEALRPRRGSMLGGKRWQSSLRLELVMAMERIAPHYGDLALPLCLFEIGHLAEQICAALRGVGCQYECRLSPSPSAEDATGEARQLAPLEIALAGQDFLSPCEEDCTAALRIAEFVLTRADRERCIRACEWARSSGGKTRIINGIGRHDLFPIPDTPEKCPRTSGNSVMGMCGLPSTTPEQDAFIASMIESYRAVQNRRFPWPAMTILRANPDFSVTAHYVSDVVQTKRIENAWTPLSEAYGTFFNVDLQTVCLYVMFSAPFATLLDQSSWGYAEMLVGSGILSQIISNDAAARGFMARAWKGMIEEKLEMAFNLEGQCFYTLAMGKCDLRNPALSVSRIGC